MNLPMDFSVSFDRICEKCGEKNLITIRWNGTEFEIVQFDCVENKQMIKSDEKLLVYRI